MASTSLVTPPAKAPSPGFRPHRITLDRYRRMIDAGVFSEKDPVFLWRGQLVEKMTKGHRHNNTGAGLNQLLVRVVPDGWHVRVEQPVWMSDDTVPEPDFMVVRGAIPDFINRSITPRDVALIVEVADSSLAVDGNEVLEKYAQESIPVYWLVNIPFRRVECYTRPEGGRYAERRVFGPDDSLPLTLDGQEVGRLAVGDLLRCV